MDNFTVINNQKEVIDYLKKGYLLVIFNKDKLVYFTKYKDSIKVYNQNYHYLLSIDDILNLYKNSDFYLYTGLENEIEIDNDKDIEYYRNWNK